jgi:hypothetical protein
VEKSKAPAWWIFRLVGLRTPLLERDLIASPCTDFIIQEKVTIGMTYSVHVKVDPNLAFDAVLGVRVINNALPCWQLLQE